ncbi:MAG: FG-GAP-like repeat-containing protein [Thiohalocapsa sp.]|nr:FG-GAP-like repeat-containing protein [Thiohalocapsa sp.]
MLAAPALFALALAGVPAHAQLQFQDVTLSAGTVGTGESWGASWGDYNGDGWSDIFMTTHRSVPRFYRNNADGTFTDVAIELDPGIWFNDPLNDQHGAAFADFDNDGDQDLYVSVSSSGPGQLLINDGGLFWEAAVDADLDGDSTARAPTFFDWTDDGFLDVAVTSVSGYQMDRQDPAQGLDFDADTTTGNVCPRRTDYTQLIDLDGDGVQEFICQNQGTFPAAAHDVTSRPFPNVSGILPATASVVDSVVADFDGDLKSDILTIRGKLRPSGATAITPNRIEAWLDGASNTSAKGFRFASPGTTTFTIDYSGLGPFGAPAELVLSPSGPTSGSADSVSVSYNSSAGEWVVSMIGNNQRAYIVVETAQPVSNLRMTGLANTEVPVPPRLIKDNGSGFAFDFGAGLNGAVACVSAVAGDFDNDMDQDIYMACGAGVENLPNRLYENQGNGRFVLVADAAGARGPVGAGLQSGVGVAESVTTSDYDNDGFLDLLVTNGLLMRPWGIGGQDTLIRNTAGDSGNTNRWLQIDLQGTASNRDGIGARIYVTAGGVTQFQEQGGGYHRWSQNDRRLHFGLAQNQSARVEIRWPSGRVDVFDNVGANVIYTANEGGQLVQTTLGPPIEDQLSPGDECGAPNIDAANIAGLWLWKDCSANRWFSRVSAGGSSSAILYQGSITSNGSFSNVSGFSLEGSDVVDTSTPGTLDFSLRVVNAGLDGVDFSLPSSASGCVALSAPPGASLLIGRAAHPVSAPFDLQTLGVCTPTATVSIADASVGEGDGSAELTLTLSAAAAVPVTVTYSTADGSATAGDDYTAVSQQITIPAGSTSATAGVPILDDTAQESNETFTVNLSSPVNAILGQASATVTIADNDDSAPGDPACGEPSYSSPTDTGVFVWRDCTAAGPDQVWNVRITGGGSDSTITYTGLITSSATLQTSGFSLEGNDVLDSVPGDGIVDYDLKAIRGGQDGFRLTVPDGASTCFDPSTMPAGGVVKVGAGGQTVTGAFDLQTLESCGTTPPPSSVACGEPSYSGPSETGLFLWRDCDAAGPDQRWNVRITGGGSGSLITYAGLITSSATLQTEGFSLEGNDVLDSAPGDGDVDYELKAIGGGQDGFALTVADGSTTCFDPSTMPTGATVQIGAVRQVVDGAFDLQTLEACGSTPPPATPSLSIDSVTVDESAGSATLTVTLSSASTTTVSVDFATENGSASAGSDYTADSGTLSFGAGQTSRTVTVAIVDDAVPEDTENFRVRLSNPSNATIGTGVGTVTVTDSDGPLTLFFDGFESSSGWVSNPNGSDTATTGAWEIGDPQGTADDNGNVMQPENARTGANALITGLEADADFGVGFADIDGGTVSIRSPAITLPSGRPVSLSLSYYLAHLSNATPDDFLRITVQGSSGGTVLLNERASDTIRTAEWTDFTVDISAFAGQTVRLVIEAADADSGSLVEAGIDDVQIRQL